MIIYSGSCDSHYVGLGGLRQLAYRGAGASGYRSTRGHRGPSFHRCACGDSRTGSDNCTGDDGRSCSDGCSPRYCSAHQGPGSQQGRRSRYRKLRYALGYA